jgi:uncharacterized protein YeaO (DUF488 family)
MRALQIRRVYAEPGPNEGRRVLVDRVWPRGLSKQDLAGVVWMKEVGPSDALRKWFAHRPERWDGFRERYFAELDHNPAVAQLRALMREGQVTLLFGAKDETHNQAVALRDYLSRES